MDDLAGWHSHRKADLGALHNKLNSFSKPVKGSETGSRVGEINIGDRISKKIQFA